MIEFTITKPSPETMLFLANYFSGMIMGITLCQLIRLFA